VGSSFAPEVDQRLRFRRGRQCWERSAFDAPDEAVGPPLFDFYPQRKITSLTQLLSIVIEKLCSCGDLGQRGRGISSCNIGGRRLRCEIVPSPFEIPVVSHDPFLEVLIAFSDLSVMPTHVDERDHQRGYEGRGKSAGYGWEDEIQGWRCYASRGGGSLARALARLGPAGGRAQLAVGSGECGPPLVGVG
jgi:hypothetical protein